MRRICKWFQNGNCKYGSRCKYDHITSTPLLDPPIWIFSKCGDLNLTEISSDEIRYALMIKDTRHILDDIWIDNYTEMYKALNDVSKEGSIESTSDRCVDIRQNPECLMVPFDLESVEKEILKLRASDPIIDSVVPSSSKDIVMEEGRKISEHMDSYTPSFVKEFTSKKRGSFGNEERNLSQGSPNSQNFYPKQENRYDRNQKSYREDRSYVHNQNVDNSFYNKGDRFTTNEKNRYTDTKTYKKYDNYPYRQDSYDKRYDSKQVNYNNRQDYYSNSYSGHRNFTDRYGSFNSRKDNYNNSSYNRQEKDYDRSGYRLDNNTKSYTDRQDNLSFNRENNKKFLDKKYFKNENSRDYSKEEDKESLEQDFEYKNVPYDYKKR